MASASKVFLEKQRKQFMDACHDIHSVEDSSSIACAEKVWDFLYLRMRFRDWIPNSQQDYKNELSEFSSIPTGTAWAGIINPFANHFQQILLSDENGTVQLQTLEVPDLKKSPEVVVMRKVVVREPIPLTEASPEHSFLWDIIYKILLVLKVYGNRLIAEEDLVFILSDPVPAGEGFLPSQLRGADDHEEVNKILAELVRYSPHTAMSLVRYKAQGSELFYYQLRS